MKAVCVLGIDGADYRLLEEWNCENLLLNTNRVLEPITHSHEYPATMEVWPTIATGQRPSQHGISSNAAETTDSLLKRRLIQLNDLLPAQLQELIIEYKQDTFGNEYPITDSSHAFEDGAILNWPGVTSCDMFMQSAKWFVDLKEGYLNIDEFKRRSAGNTGQCLGWLTSQDAVNVPIAGVHIHILDHFGHIYAERPKKLREIYEFTDDLVGWLRDRVPHLIILSDHGMQTSERNDSDPGVHSKHGVISATDAELELPSHVLDVHDFLAALTDEFSAADKQIEFDTPIEHLEDMGYL